MTAPTDRLAEAEALLYRTIEVVDPDTGARTRRRTETPRYRQYLELRAALERARAAHTAALREAQQTAAGRNTWPMVGATLQMPVQQALERLRSAGAEAIERAEALLKQAATGE
jgi:hypothetical protein